MANKPKRLFYLDRTGTAKDRKPCSIAGCSKIRQLSSYLAQGKKVYSEHSTCCDHNTDGTMRKGQDQLQKNERRWKHQGYEFSTEKYDALLKTQNGLCAICGRPQGGKQRRHAVDHDHNTGKVRGLLCSYCNRFLGWLENYTTLDALKEYLQIGEVQNVQTAPEKVDDVSR